MACFLGARQLFSTLPTYRYLLLPSRGPVFLHTCSYRSVITRGARTITWRCDDWYTVTLFAELLSPSAGCAAHQNDFERDNPSTERRRSPNFALCLAVSWAGILYIHFGVLLPPGGIFRCKLHFASKSCVLYWQRYCTALEQRASAKLCGVVQGIELRNFRCTTYIWLGGHHVGHRPTF